MISGFLFLVVIVLINKRLAVLALAIFIVLNLAMPGFTLAELVLWCCLWVLATVAAALLAERFGGGRISFGGKSWGLGAPRAFDSLNPPPVCGQRGWTRKDELPLGLTRREE